MVRRPRRRRSRPRRRAPAAPPRPRCADPPRSPAYRMSPAPHSETARSAHSPGASGAPALARATQAASRVPAFPVQREERSTPRMAKKRSEPRKMSAPTPFEQARDELFSHILRCGVLEATPEHQKEWFDDTMLYLAERYDALD